MVSIIHPLGKAAEQSGGLSDQLVMAFERQRQRPCGGRRRCGAEGSAMFVYHVDVMGFLPGDFPLRSRRAFCRLAEEVSTASLARP